MEPKPEWQTATEEAKPAINDVLFRFLPASCTLGRMEEMAIIMYDLVMEEWDKVINEPEC